MPAANYHRNCDDDLVDSTPRVPPITLDLRNLTDKEERLILDVIRRDEHERAILDAKISEIRREIQDLRKAGALVDGDDPSRMCARCKAKIVVGGAKLLPWVVGAKAERCAVCKFLVCPNCRAWQANGTGGGGSWVCSLCQKYRQEKLLSGEWATKGHCSFPVGSDLLRQSLRDRRNYLKSQGQVHGNDFFPYTVVEEHSIGHSRNPSAVIPLAAGRSSPGLSSVGAELNVGCRSAIGRPTSSVSGSSSPTSSPGGRRSPPSLDNFRGRPITLSQKLTGSASSPTIINIPVVGAIGRKSPSGSVSDDTTSCRSEENDTVRDSDSGVTSANTSRTTTPEQRSYQSTQQHQPRASQQLTPQENRKYQLQPPQQQQQQQAQTSVPSIAVTATNSVDECDEADDNLDELFTHHRSNYLGSRSSLADSRESIYSVYSDAGEAHYGRIPVTGDIQFHLTYDYKHSILMVHVKQCRNLASVDTKRNRSDPYVKTYLLPDKSRASKRKTKIKKHTLNPSFDEVLKYNISKTELESRVLWLAVWHNDRLGRNDFLGEVTVPLDYYRFDTSSPQWYQLAERAPVQEDMTLMVYKGDLFISLKFVTADMVDSSSPKRKSGSKSRSKEKNKSYATSDAGELHVLVREARNLTAMRGNAGSNPFCKGYLLPDPSHESKQKTPVMKKTTNPQWKHTLVFPGAVPTMLPEHCLELTVWDHESMGTNDFLGGVRLNIGMGTQQGRPVEWMDAQGEEVDVWRTMMDNPGQWVDAQIPLRANMGGRQVKK